ncbi:MAG: S-layer homology domain-containing protein, partial [Chloroflexota bacterium]|nr:S-layer homology domain-containing protein [Chloroflexota bacterium]
AGLFSSSNLAPGQGFSFTFTTAGSYGYHCQYHGGVGTGMHGTIVVVSSACATGTSTPTTTATATGTTSATTPASATSTSVPGSTFTTHASATPTTQPSRTSTIVPSSTSPTQASSTSTSVPGSTSTTQTSATLTTQSTSTTQASATSTTVAGTTSTTTSTTQASTTLTTQSTSTTQPSRTSTTQPGATGTTQVTSTDTSTTRPSTTTRTTSTGTPTPTTKATAQATDTATPAGTATVCPIQFTDVPTSNTFYSYVRCLACRGIVSGYQCGGHNPLTDQLEPCDSNNSPYFRYNNPISRGQISKLVANSAGFSEDPGAQIYEDVPPVTAFYPFVNRLTTRVIMGGYPCGLGPDEPCNGPANRPYFRPAANATRGQLSKIVSNAAGYTEHHSEQTFEDVGTGNTFYIYVQRLASRDVMQGYTCGGANPETGQAERCYPPANKPYFRWANTVTRGQASKIVANTFFPGCQTSAKK